MYQLRKHHLFCALTCKHLPLGRNFHLPPCVLLSEIEDPLPTKCPPERPSSRTSIDSAHSETCVHVCASRQPLCTDCSSLPAGRSISTCHFSRQKICPESTRTCTQAECLPSHRGPPGKPLRTRLTDPHWCAHLQRTDSVLLRKVSLQGS